MKIGSYIDSFCSAYYAVKNRIKDNKYITTYHFLQTWGSTALGFEGIGGQAFTDAYTTVIAADDLAYVFFAGRLAYTVYFEDDVFKEDLANRRLENCRNADRKYRIVPLTGAIATEDQ